VAVGAPVCPNDVPAKLATLVTTDAFKRATVTSDADPANHPITFLALDHRSGEWAIYKWHFTGATPVATDFVAVKGVSLGPNGVPKVALGRSDRGFFVLTNTTPPLYKLSKTTTLSDIKELANFNALLDALSKFVLTFTAINVGNQPSSFTLAEGPVRKPPPGFFDDIKTQLASVNDQAKALDRLKQESFRLLQYAELAEMAPGPSLSEINGALPKLRTAYAELERSRNAVTTTAFGKQHGCKALLDIVKKGEATNFSSSSEIDKTIAKLTPEILASNCSDDAKAAALDALTGQERFKAYVDIMPQYHALLELVDTAIGTEPTAIANAAELRDLFAGKTTIDPCDYIAGVILADSADQITFDKTGAVAVTIAKQDRLGKTFTRRPNAEAAFNFQTVNPVSDRIGFSVAMTISNIKDPEFKAAPNPADASKKVITRSSEKTRAGDIAVLGVYRWTPPTSPLRSGVQFGFGASKDLETFLGYSLDIGPILRIGVGITGQQVTGLARGQKAMKLKPDGTPDPDTLTVVADDSAIQKRAVLKGGWYASISLSLDSLSLFKKPN